MFDSAFSEALIDAALSYGADEAEIYCCKSSETGIMVDNGHAEMVSVQSDDGFAIRILKDSRMAFASSNSSDRKAAVDLVKETAARVRLHSQDQNNVIPEFRKNDISGVKEPFDADLASLPLSTKIDKALAIERVALDYDPRIRGFGWLEYGDSVQEYRIYNSRNVKAESRGTIVYAFTYAVAGDSDTVQTGTHLEPSGSFAELSAEKIGATVAKNAIRMLGATAARTGEYPIVLPPETSSAFLNALADMLSADLVQKGKSPFRDRLGQAVAASDVTVIDDGALPGGLATSEYDSEGVPTTTTTLIDAGVLKTFLYDSYCAKKAGTHSTGNASRSNYHARPSITPSNFYMRPGDVEQEELIRQVAKGLYITEVSGLHAAINPTTADFSVPAKALLVENGEFAGGADDLTISGNILSLLKNIVGIANDLTWTPGSGMIGAPTILISDTKITGRQ